MNFILVTLAGILSLGNIKCSTFSDCSSSEMDIIFLLDKSSDVGGSNFQAQLNFLINTIDTYDVSPTGTHVGLATFSDTGKMEIELDAYTDKNNLMNDIDGIKYEQPGDRNMEAGLEFVLTNCFDPAKGDRPDVMNLLVILTAGGNFQSQRIKEISKQLQKSGLAIYAIGITPSVSSADLAAIIPDATHVFRINNYDGLSFFLPLIKGQICTVAKQQKIKIQMALATTTTTTTMPTTAAMFSSAFFQYEWTTMPLPMSTASLPTSTKRYVPTTAPRRTPSLSMGRSSVSKPPVAVTGVRHSKQHITLTTSPSMTVQTGVMQGRGKKQNQELSTEESPGERPSWLMCVEIAVLSTVALIIIGGFFCMCKSACLLYCREDRDDDEEEEIYISEKRRRAGQTKRIIPRNYSNA